jgi:hypothetical protein
MDKMLVHGGTEAGVPQILSPGVEQCSRQGMEAGVVKAVDGSVRVAAFDQVPGAGQRLFRLLK